MCSSNVRQIILFLTGIFFGCACVDIVACRAQTDSIPHLSKIHINNAVFRPNGEQILIVSHSEAQLWDLKNGHVVERFGGVEEAIRIAAFSIDGKYLAIGTGGQHENGVVPGNAVVKVFEVDTGKPVIEFVNGKAAIGMCQFLADGKTIIASDKSGTVSVWNLESGGRLFTFGGQQLDPNSVKVSRNDRLVLGILAGRAKVNIWSLETGKLKHSIDLVDPSIISADFGVDDDQVVFARSDGSIQIWDIAIDSRLKVAKEHSDKLTVLKISPDGTRIVFGSLDKTVQILDAENLEALGKLVHPGPIRDVQINAEGTRLITEWHIIDEWGGVDTTKSTVISLWNVERKQEIKRWRANFYGSAFARFSPDGAAIFFSDEKAVLIDSISGITEKVLE